MPFTGPTAQAIMTKRFVSPVPHVKAMRDVPDGLDQVVSRQEMLGRLERRYGRIEPIVETSTAPADRFRLPDSTT